MNHHTLTSRFVGPFTLAVIVLAAAAPAHAQTIADDDAMLDVAEPDFTLVNLPTTLRLPVGGGNFHLSHHFNENLRQDSLADQASNLFGLDQGANIALEFRFGVMRHLQAVAQRTSLNRAIQFSAKYDAWHQHGSMPMSISGLAAVEGDNNFRRNYAPAFGVIVSRTIAERLALYATPVFVANTATGGPVRRNTGFVGVGANLRLRSTTYLIGEVSPRTGGLTIGDPEFALAIEKRVGGHVFSLTFANGAETTYRQLAHGGVPEGLYLGFNLSRKFF
jgi:Membrane bound beta barrel domain (DUF5777)